MHAILALDQGTTSSRALVFSSNGNVLGAAHEELTQRFPQPGWVEHDPEEIWQSQYRTALAALAAAGLQAADIAAIGITNQRETTVLWNRTTGTAIGNAIVWQDRRTASDCERIRAAGMDERVRETTGLIVDAYFSATKIAWLLDHVDGARDAAQHGDLAFGTIDSWLIWKLTGGVRHVTDATNASRTMLFDINACTWSDELLALFNVPRSVLPSVLPCTSNFGSTVRDLFGVPLAIAGVAGDQQASLFGQGGFAPGAAKNTYGTGAFVMLNTGSRMVRPPGILCTIASSFGDSDISYALEGSVFNSGSAIQWLRDGIAIIDAAAESEALAQQVSTTDDLYFVPAFTGLGAPYWDAHARGTIIGITRGTKRSHIARATLEAIAFQTADVLGAMQAAAGSRIGELRVDGGGSTNDTLMQMQADILGVDVLVSPVSETTALGAAYFAGLHCGLWADLDALARLEPQRRRFVPSISADERAGRLARWHDAVARSRAWTV